MSTIISFDEYYSEIDRQLLSADNDKELFEAIVNAPFHHKLHATNFDLGMIVLALANKKNHTIDRMAYSHTSPAMDAVKASSTPFEKIRIPLDAKDNITSAAIKLGEPQKTADWRYLFTPVMSEEASRSNQAEAGMDCSFIYPLNCRDGGALIFSFYQDLSSIQDDHQNFMKNYSCLASKRLSK